MNPIPIPAAPIKRPSLLKLFLEFRAIFELSAFFLLFPIFLKAPPGDGHPVLIIPGFLAKDNSTLPLRSFLKYKGYKPHGWGLGRNLGREVNFRHGISNRLLNRVNELRFQYNQKVSLIGWSLGGIYARELAREMNGSIRMVISLGSPFFYIDAVSNATPLYKFLNGKAERINQKLQYRFQTPPPVPSTAIFSRTDGIVHWQACYDHQYQRFSKTENVEVEGSHCGLGHNPLALWVIADRLAQPENAWQPFERSGFKKIVYRDPYRLNYFWK